LGSARGVWLHLRSEALSFPLQKHYGAAIRWVDPSYIAIYHVLTNRVYAGAYAYGKNRFESTLDASGLLQEASPEAAGFRMAGAHPKPP
jgi:hypothetical protein